MIVFLLCRRIREVVLKLLHLVRDHCEAIGQDMPDYTLHASNAQVRH